ncbi:MAG: iron complex outermembrane receptor protein [Candidatus Azotimanducaceae bacterium]|jgi:iron complex outermembrane receptor protein
MFHPVKALTIAISTAISFGAIAETDRTEMEEVTVVASRIERPDNEYSNPVLSLTGDIIRASGIRDLSLYLKQIPALSGSTDTSDTVGGEFAGTNGLSALNLRHLGFTRTLVLVNGRRYVASPFPGAAVVDIDTLPMNLIERVEVMTGGASALYGADGVSGVVNIVMKDDYEGLDISGQSAASSQGDAESNSLNMTYGQGFAGDRGHISLGVSYAKDNGLNHQQRAFTSGVNYATFAQNPDNPNGDADKPDQIPIGDLRFSEDSRAGAVDINLDAIPEFNGDGSVWDAGRFIDPIHQQGGDGAPIVEFLSDLLPKQERQAINLLVDFDLSEGLNIFSEFAYSKNSSDAAFEPIFDFVLAIFPGGAFTPAHIELAAAGSPVLVSRDNWDMGVRTDETKRDTFRTVFGARGDIGKGFEFEVSYTFGESDVETRILNQRFNDRFAAALDSVVDPVSGDIVCASELDTTAEPFNLQFQEWNNYDPLPGTWAGSYMPGQGDCVPINVFGEGSPSQASIDWIMLDTVAEANMQQHVVQAYVKGDTSGWFEMPAGAIGLVAGVEWRKDEVNNKTAEEDRLGLTFGNKGDPDQGSVNVAEVFAEIDVPILVDAKFAKYLAFDAAIRYSDYSTSGSATTWKTGLVWQPIESLSFRATIAEATRAPSLGELFSPAGQTFEFIDDPCGVTNLGNGDQTRTDNCAALLNALGVDPTTFSPLSGAPLSGIIGGNSDLTQEVADTFTWGVILTPSFIENLTISLDWYDIELADAINYSSPQDLANLCVDLQTSPNAFCDLAPRAADGTISTFTQQPNNVETLTTKGVDFTVVYQLDTNRWGKGDWGTFNFRVFGNHLQELKLTSLPGAAPVPMSGQKQKPEWQANLDAAWQKENILLRWQAHYFGETYRFDEATMRNNPNIVAAEYLKFDSGLTHDLYGSYTFNDAVTVYVGMNNVTNETPDVGEVGYPVSVIGRYLFAGFNVAL